MYNSNPNGLQFYKSHFYRQKGKGIGSFFGNLFSRLLPFAKNVLLPAAKKHIMPHAAKMARDVATDVLINDQPLRGSLKSHGIDALKNAGSSMLSQSGSGIRRIKTRKRKRSKLSTTNRKKKGRFVRSTSKKPNKKRRKRTDIFG